MELSMVEVAVRLKALRGFYSLFFKELFENATYLLKDKEKARKAVLFVLMHNMNIARFGLDIGTMRDYMFGLLQQFADHGGEGVIQPYQVEAFEAIYDSCYKGVLPHDMPKGKLFFRDYSIIIFTALFFKDAAAQKEIQTVQLRDNDIQKYYNDAKYSLCYVAYRLGIKMWE